MWAVFGVFSVVLTAVAWWFALNVRRSTQLFTWSSSLCTAFTSVMAYAMVADWVNQEDWSAVMDVAPTMYKLLIIYTVIVMVSNLGAALYENSKK